MPGTISHTFTTSRGNVYQCHLHSLTVKESRDRAVRNRAFQADLKRLQARLDIAQKAMDRYDAVEVNDDTDIDELYENIDTASVRLKAAEDAASDHLDSYDLLGLFVSSIDHYNNLADLPQDDYNELVDLTRDYIDGGTVGEAQSSE